MIEPRKHYCEFPHITLGDDGKVETVNIAICAKRAIGKFKGAWYCPQHLAEMDPDFAEK